MNHREQALDDFFFNLLGKGGKRDVACCSLFYRSSKFQPLIRQDLRGWCRSCLPLHPSWDAQVLPGAAASRRVLPCRRGWTGPPHHDGCPLWGSLHTGAGQPCPLVSQPAAWQEATRTTLASRIPARGLSWEHVKKQPAFCATFLCFLSWKATTLSFCPKLTKSVARGGCKTHTASGRAAVISV